VVLNLLLNNAWSSKIILLFKHVIDQGFFSEGSQNTVGEFFNSGYDCADILNKRQDAKDGFYWITLKLSNPKKVRIILSIEQEQNCFLFSGEVNRIQLDFYG
jgi:hypothetical protein